MASRLELHARLKEILGNNNVYFQPPNNLKLNFPCIVYELGRIDKVSADNRAYVLHHLYTVTLIHDDPDNTIKESIMELTTCRFDRSFKSDGMNHYVYDIYY